MHGWIRDFPAAITICDRDGTITEMNEKACQNFAKYGGADLIGTSVYACHPPYAVEKIKHMLATGEKNAYTIQKQGIKKLIYQQPWYDNGEIAGVVEMSLEIPADMKHYDRD